ncbi:MAG: mitochondrial fission ELM1 family protein [Pseudomonadota bacterium]
MSAPVERAAIWVVTDGRAGNENPAKALAAGVARAIGSSGDAVRVIRLALRPGAAALPPTLWMLRGPRLGGWPFTALNDRGAALAPPYPALVIGAGRRSAPFVLALKRLSGGSARAVQILDPKLAPTAFDLVVAPAHDGLSGPNTHRTIGSLHDVAPETLRGERHARLEALASPLIGVLVGGDAKGTRLSLTDAERLLAALRPAAARGAGLAATPSRRTPEPVKERLRTAIEAMGGFFWDGAEPNPLRPILAQADALVVTADSANMASEAAGAGKPLFLAPLDRLSPKLARFGAALVEGGYAKPLPPALDAGALATPQRRRLDDRAAVVARILPLLADPAASSQR